MWIDPPSRNLHHPRASTEHKEAVVSARGRSSLEYPEVALIQLLPGDHSQEVGKQEVKRHN
jgi:hypothetical protein